MQINENLFFKIMNKRVEVEINKTIPGQIEGGNKQSAGNIKRADSITSTIYRLFQSSLFFYHTFLSTQ